MLFSTIVLPEFSPGVHTVQAQGEMSGYTTTTWDWHVVPLILIAWFDSEVRYSTQKTDLQ
jgi:hypothetical protein